MPDPLIALLITTLLVSVAALLFFPDRGLLPRWQRARRMSERVLTEDALKHIHRFETHDLKPTLQSTAGALDISVNQAAHILNDLEARELVQIRYDPHGDPIPTAAGDLQPHGGKPLTAMDVDVPLRIVHIEDEPDVVYAQLVAEGLHPGMEARLTEISPQRVRFWAGDDEHVLAPVVAANISVCPLPEPEKVEPSPGERLSSLKPGEAGRVLNISPTSRGAERRRLMDLGIVPGTVIAAEFLSPSGDPMAYRVRGALIALRQEQADLINIASLEEVTA
jgi:DtxR family Mn-dependent transcriptional regulator